jgi:hypothetical protein
MGGALFVASTEGVLLRGSNIELLPAPDEPQQLSGSLSYIAYLKWRMCPPGTYVYRSGSRCCHSKKDFLNFDLDFNDKRCVPFGYHWSREDTEDWKFYNPDKILEEQPKDIPCPLGENACLGNDDRGIKPGDGENERIKDMESQIRRHLSSATEDSGMFSTRAESEEDLYWREKYLIETWESMANKTYEYEPKPVSDQYFLSKVSEWSGFKEPVYVSIVEGFCEDERDRSLVFDPYMCEQGARQLNMRNDRAGWFSVTNLPFPPSKTEHWGNLYRPSEKLKPEGCMAPRGGQLNINSVPDDDGDLVQNNFDWCPATKTVPGDPSPAVDSWAVAFGETCEGEKCNAEEIPLGGSNRCCLKWDCTLRQVRVVRGLREEQSRACSPREVATKCVGGLPKEEVDVVLDGEIVKELQCKPKMYHSEEPPESLTWDEAIRFQWTCATRDVNDEVKGCSVADCMDQNTQGGNEPSPPLFMKKAACSEDYACICVLDHVDDIVNASDGMPKRLLGYGPEAQQRQRSCMLWGNYVDDPQSETTGGGGALAVGRGGSVKIDGCDLTKNEAAKGDGGAISIIGNRGSVIVLNSVIRQNAAINGGFVSIKGASTIFLQESHAWQNEARINGGVFALDGPSALTWRYGAIVNNHALTNGGAGYVGGVSSLNLYATAFMRNKAQQYGGAIMATHIKKPIPQELTGATGPKEPEPDDEVQQQEEDSVRYEKCVFTDSSLYSENVAGQGGSIFWQFTEDNEMSVLTPQNCTMRDNVPTDDGLATNTVRVIMTRWVSETDYGNIYSGSKRTKKVETKNKETGEIEVEYKEIASLDFETSAPTTRSGVTLAKMNPNTESPSLEAQDYYSQISQLDYSTRCSMQVREYTDLSDDEKVGYPLVRENAVVDFGDEVASSAGVISLDKLAVRADIGASYYFRFVCKDGDADLEANMLTNLTFLPCAVAMGLTEQRRCQWCPAGQYSHTGISCLPCPEGGNCTQVILNQDLGGDRAGELVNITRGVELPSSLASWWNELAPRSKRVTSLIVGDPNNLPYSNLGTNDYCYWQQGICSPGEEEVPIDDVRRRELMTSLAPSPASQAPKKFQYNSLGKRVECKKLKDVPPEQLYQCLTGRHLYYCPSGENACPASDFTGCIGSKADRWRELNVTYDALPDDPFQGYYLEAEKSECEGGESVLDIASLVTNSTNESTALRLCAKECASVSDQACSYFLFSYSNTSFPAADGGGPGQRRISALCLQELEANVGSCDKDRIFSLDPKKKKDVADYYKGPDGFTILKEDPQRNFDVYRMNLDTFVRAMLVNPNGIFRNPDADILRGLNRDPSKLLHPDREGAWINETLLNMSVPLESGGNCYFNYNPLRLESDLTWNGTVWDTSRPETCIRSCGLGYGGPKCDRCLAGYFRSALGECVSCALFGDRATSMKVFTYIGLGLFACVVLGLWLFMAAHPGKTVDSIHHGHCCYNDKQMRMIQIKKDQRELLRRKHGRGQSKLSSEEGIEDDPHKHVLLSFRSEKFKIMLTFVQIFSQFKKNYGVRWPYLTSTYMRYLAGFNLDIVRVLPLDCIYRTNYYTVLVMTLVLPFLVLLVCCIVAAGGRLYYRSLILSIPRRCVKTGRLVRGWMPKIHYEQMLVRIAKNILLEDDNHENDTMDDIHDKAAELHEQYTSGIPPGISYLAPLRHNETRLSDHHGEFGTFDEMIEYNIKTLRKRVMERLHYRTFANKIWKVLFWAILLGYPSICMRVMRIYQCEEVGDKLLLVHDLGLDCGNSDWQYYTSLATVATFCYVMGAPLMFWFLLYSARNERVQLMWKKALPYENRMRMLLILAKADSQVLGLTYQDPHTIKEQKILVCAYLKRRNLRMHRVQHRLGFLYYAYRDSRWWYEVVELFRKFLLNGMIVVIKTGDSSQLLVGLIICFFYLMLVFQVRPHLAASDHWLMVTTHVQLCITLFCGIMLSEKLEYMGAFVFNRKQARTAEVFSLELIIIVSHMGTCMFGIASILYERYFSPESFDIEKRRKHLATLRKKVHAKVQRRWGKLHMEHSKKAKSAKDSSAGSIAMFMAHQSIEELSSEDPPVINAMGKGLLSRLRVKGKLKEKKKGLFGLLASGGKTDTTKVSPAVAASKDGENDLATQLAALRRSQSQIRAESKSGKPVDFDWGDEHDNEDEDEDDDVSTGGGSTDNVEEKKTQDEVNLFAGKDPFAHDTDESSEDEEADAEMLSLRTPVDEKNFLDFVERRSQKIKDEFETLRKHVAKTTAATKERFARDRYDETAPTHVLHKRVKDQVESLTKVPGPSIIAELHTYIEYVKSQAPLRKASGVVILKRAQADLVEREKKAIAELRGALGMDDKHPEKQSLDQQEETLERTIGAVMQCGVEAMVAGPLLTAGIEMMTEVDKCRQLNAMIELNLFGSDEALKSFSSLGRQPEIQDDLLQNVVRALFVLIGSPRSSVEDWNKCRKLCSPAGYATLKRRIKECSPLSAGMTQRVKVASELVHGYHDYSEMPEEFVAGLACHCWVFGIMAACGMDDPRTHVERDSATVAEDEDAFEDGSEEEGAKESASDSSSSSAESDSDSGEEESVSASSGAAAAAAAAGTKLDGTPPKPPAPPPSKADDGESSSSSDSDSSGNSDDDIAKANTAGLKTEKKMFTPAPPKEPPRLKTTPKNVVLPDANFKVKLSDSEDESDRSSSQASSSDSVSSDDEE